MTYHLIKGPHYENIADPVAKEFLNRFIGKNHNSIETLAEDLSSKFNTRFEDLELLKEGSIEEAPVYYMPIDYIVAYITKEKTTSDW
jgi:dihydroneopterin aldolase